MNGEKKKKKGEQRKGFVQGEPHTPWTEGGAWQGESVLRMNVFGGLDFMAAVSSLSGSLCVKIHAV